PEATFDPVPSGGRSLVARHDHAHPGISHGGRGVQDVQVGRPAPLPPLKQRTDLLATRDPPRARQPLPPTLIARRCCHLPPEFYFEPTATTSRLRPFFRRRLSTSRPARVLIRARNPCLLRRFRFRGRYVGLPIQLPRGTNPFLAKLVSIATA